MALFSSHTLTCSSPTIPTLMGTSVLVPVKLAGKESLNELFEYQLTLKTPDSLNPIAALAADYELDSFLGRELTVNIELEGAGSFISGAMGATGLGNLGAGTREISGLISSASFLREEGRHILYQVTLKPWLYLATLTTDCKIFQDKSVVEVLDTVFADYNFSVDKRLVKQYPKRDYQTQYNETDFDFINRLCQEWGISWFFEHSDGKHRLVLIDSMGAHKANPSLAYKHVNFYTPGHKVDEEYLNAFVPHKQLTSGRYATTDYDYNSPKADLSVSQDDPRNTAQSSQDVFAFHTAQSGSANYAQPKAGPNQATNDPQEEGGMLAKVRMQALRSVGHRAQASGNLRGMVPGCTFTLGKHPQSAANAEYLILGAHLLIEEIAQESQIIDSLRGQNYIVHVELDLHPTVGETYRPALTARKPTTSGVQTAVVVGTEGENIWTDELGRIKVQFPWDRYGQHNQHSTCWIRSSEVWAGNQLGSIHLPRIGQEVLVDFISGDPDLPVCTGRVNNQINMPAWQLPAQQALSGFRSRELTQGGGNAASGRSNHLILDDTDEKIQTQLKSDHQASQLSLGHITRIDDNAGRKDARGEGFELRTDAHGAVRAAEGLLITTEARQNAQAHITDMGETTARLVQAQSQHDSLGELAKQHQAQDEQASQAPVAKVLEAQNKEVKGEQSKELKAPHLVLASPAGIETTTPKTTHIASGEHIALTSGGHTSMSVGKGLLASVKQGIRLFTYKLGLKLISGKDDIEIQALKDSINKTAKLGITLTAEKIAFTAKEEIVVNGGTSYTKWNAGAIEEGTNGAWVAHAASHGMPGPANKPMPKLPEPKPSKENLGYVLSSHFNGQGYIYANEPYQLLKGGAVIGKGVTDEYGHVKIPHQEGTAEYSVKLSNGSVFKLPVHQK